MGRLGVHWQKANDVLGVGKKLGAAPQNSEMSVPIDPNVRRLRDAYDIHTWQNSDLLSFWKMKLTNIEWFLCATHGCSFFTPF